MESRQIILAGIGMGSGDVITEEVRQLIEEADCLIGAERMITSAQQIRNMNGLSMRQCESKNRDEEIFFKEYRTEEIVSYIKEHKEHSKIGILLSGDTGFYSGAKKLKERLTEVCSDQIKIYFLTFLSCIKSRCFMGRCKNPESSWKRHEFCTDDSQTFEDISASRRKRHGASFL